jgi:hypothetical protein
MPNGVSVIPLNWGILLHWQNWARVLLMVAIVGIAFDLIGRNIRVRKDVN